MLVERAFVAVQVATEGARIVSADVSNVIRRRCDAALVFLFLYDTIRRFEFKLKLSAQRNCFQFHIVADYCKSCSAGCNAKINTVCFLLLNITRVHVHIHDNFVKGLEYVTCQAAFPFCHIVDIGAYSNVTHENSIVLNCHLEPTLSATLVTNLKRHHTGFKTTYFISNYYCFNNMFRKMSNGI